MLVALRLTTHPLSSRMPLLLPCLSYSPPVPLSAIMSSFKHQQEAEYLELYRSMQQQAVLQASQAPAGGAASPPPPMPTPEAFVAALSSAAASAPNEDGEVEEDPEDARRSFVWPGLSLSPSALLAFRLSAWLPLLRKHTMPTRFVPLPPDFVDYLMEDGVWIPEHLAPVQPDNFMGRDTEDDTAAERREEAARWRATVEEINSSDEEEDAAEEAAEAKQRARQSQPFFPELVAEIQSHIDALNGSSSSGGVFPSLDWHAPTDATWITTERVAKCNSVGDILLLLKSSDKVQTEVEAPFDNCSQQSGEERAAAGSGSAAASSDDATAAAADHSSPAVPSHTPTLALRKWSTLHPSKLFRCFVYSGTLLAVCQLDVSNFYEFLQGTDEREALQDAIEGWLEDEQVCETLQAQLGIRHAVMDVYVDTNERVWLVKLKPFWPRATDSLLFTWKELYALAQQHDQEQADKAAKREQMRAAPPMPMTAPNADGSFTLPTSWPSDASLTVPFRVVTSAGAGLDVLRAVSNLATQFPSDGFDVSDGPAIEKWIQRVEEGDLKQK